MKWQYIVRSIVHIQLSFLGSMSQGAAEALLQSSGPSRQCPDFMSTTFRAHGTIFIFPRFRATLEVFYKLSAVKAGSTFLSGQNLCMHGVLKPF